MMLEEIYNCLARLKSATAAQVANELGYSVNNVSSMLSHLVSNKKIYKVGKSQITLGRTVTLYGIEPVVSAQKEYKSSRQTWLSALYWNCDEAQLN